MCNIDKRLLRWILCARQILRANVLKLSSEIQREHSRSRGEFWGGGTECSITEPYIIIGARCYTRTGTKKALTSFTVVILRYFTTPYTIRRGINKLLIRAADCMVMFLLVDFSCSYHNLFIIDWMAGTVWCPSYLCAHGGCSFSYRR